MRIKWLVPALLAIAALKQPTLAQGPLNPNFIVPTAPFGTSNNRAASTAFVQAATTGLLGTNNNWTGLNTFIDPPFVPFHTDLWALGSPVRIGHQFSLAKKVGLLIEQYVPVMGAVPAYESAALLIETRNDDPSVALGSGASATDFRCFITFVNPAGACWSLYGQTTIEPGGDGVGIGAEISVENGGASQPLVGTATTKYNVKLTSKTNPNTVGLYFEPTGPGWHKGIWATPASLSGVASSRFIELDGAFSITKAGFTFVGGTTLTAHPLGIQAESAGGLGIGIQGRASDGIGTITWYSNDLGTVYASLASNSTPELVTGTQIVPAVAGTINSAKSSNPWLGVYTRNVIINGSTAQSVTQTAQATAGNATVTWGTSTGTPAVTASSPLAISSATGNITLSLTTTTCTNQFVTAISNAGVGTCTTDTLASAQHANQGTTTTVLHGNAAGNPSWAAVAISTDVSGLGTNVATFLGTPSSANLAAAITDETGSGKAVFDTMPTIQTQLIITCTQDCVVQNGNSTNYAGMTLNNTSGTGAWLFGVSGTAGIGTAGEFILYEATGFGSAFGLAKTTGNARFLSTTDATSATAASLKTAGGIASAKAIWAGTTLTIGTAASDATHTDATLCRDTTSGLVLAGSGAAGICLGTSGRQFKTDFSPMTAGIDDLMKIDIGKYRYRRGYGDNGAKVMYGPTAQDVEAVIPELAGHDVNGETINYDTGGLFFVGLRAIQQLKAANDNLRAEVEQLKRSIAR